jgi:SAM-dependent methyltransferase
MAVAGWIAVFHHAERCDSRRDDIVDDRAGRAEEGAWWGSGAAYESYVGRWSRPVAREFLGWLAVPPSGRWLDVGCGTGALSETILSLAAPGGVVGIDPSPEFVAFARDRVRGLSALVRSAKHGFDVEDGGTVDRFQVVDRDPVFLHGLDPNGVQADGVGTVGRPRGEHARKGPVRVATWVYREHVAAPLV